jgi:hypothetical protein
MVGAFISQPNSLLSTIPEKNIPATTKITLSSRTRLAPTSILDAISSTVRTMPTTVTQKLWAKCAPS